LETTNLHTSEATGSAPIRLKALAGLFWRTWPYLKPQWKHILIWVVLNSVIGLLVLGGFMAASDLFNNKILVGEPLEPLQAELLSLDSTYVDVQQLTQDQRRVVRDRMLLGFGILAAVLMGSNLVIPYYLVWIMQRINQHLRVTMIERAEHLSLRYHSHARTGDAIYRVYQDSAMITNIVQNVLLEPLKAAGSLVLAAFVATLFSPYLGLLVLAAAAPIVWLVAWYTPRLQLRSRLARTTNSNLTSRIQEAFTAIRVIKANLLERTVLDRFNSDSRTALDAAFYLRVNLVLMRTGVVLLSTGAVILAEYLMASWVVQGKTTFMIGTFALVGFTMWNLGAYQSASSRALEGVGGTNRLVYMWGVVQDMAIGLDRAFYLLDLKPDVVDAEDPAPFPAPIRAVTYRNVHFAYEPGRPVLEGVDLTARTGTITAVVGSTGTGKSTLMSMLLRLYDPDSGTILINDTDLRDIRIDDLRAGIAIALQQNVLFATTIAGNIGYAARDASQESIEAAARVACADTFIEEMASGYDTQLGERGGKLSTGQRQRLTIARAILRDTPILILDEPTASLDAETEHQVLRNLSRWGRDRVVFVVTHRLSTIRNADQIVFLENGRVVEAGTHDELVRKENGRYRSFALAETEGHVAGNRGGHP